MDRLKRLVLEPLKRLGAWLVVGWSDVLCLILAVSLLAWVAEDAFGAPIVTMSPGSDYWEHSATLRGLLDSPFRPHNPQVISPVPSPRFVPTFILAALISRPLGLDAIGAMGVASCLNLSLLLAGIFCFFRSYFRDRRASLLGGLVMFTSWYDGWHFSNVYQLRVLFSTVSYPSTAALGLSLLGFAITLRALRGAQSWPWLAGCALIWATVMITHPLTAMLGFAGAGLLALTDPKIPWRRRLEVGGAIALGGLLSLAWPYYSVRAVLTTGSHDEVSAIVHQLSGMEGEPTGRLHQFYRESGLLRALGLALVGLPICLYLMIRRRHWFISLGAISMLTPFVINAYVPLPLGHRFILLAIFYLQVAVVWLLLKALRGAPEAVPFITRGALGWISGALVGLLLLACLHHNVEHARNHLGYMDRRMRRVESPHVRVARVVADYAGPNAVVLADAKTSWPLPTFGPKVLVLFHPNPLIPDMGARETAVATFLSSSASDAEREDVLQRYGVTHVLVTRKQLGRVEEFLSDHPRRRVGNFFLYSLIEPSWASPE